MLLIGDLLQGHECIAALLLPYSDVHHVGTLLVDASGKPLTSNRLHVLEAREARFTHEDITLITKNKVPDAQDLRSLETHVHVRNLSSSINPFHSSTLHAHNQTFRFADERGKNTTPPLLPYVSRRITTPACSMCMSVLMFHHTEQSPPVWSLGRPYSITQHPPCSL